MKYIQRLLFCGIIFLFFGCNSTQKKIELAVLIQMKEYPESTLQDIYKNFYQDRFGTGHAVSNQEATMQWLERELLEMDNNDTTQTIELLGWEHRFVRIPLGMVKTGKISKEDLNLLFVASAFDMPANAGDAWKEEWKQVTDIIQKRKLPIKNFSQDKKYIDSLLNENPVIALHHSSEFRQHYSPHYRVVRKELVEEKLGSTFVNRQ